MCMKNQSVSSHVPEPPSCIASGRDMVEAFAQHQSRKAVLHLMVDNDVQSLNISLYVPCSLITKFLKSTETNELQPRNNSIAYISLLISQLLKSNETNERQPLNKLFALETLLVFQLLKSNETNERQPLNKLSINLALLVLNELKSNETNELQLLNKFSKDEISLVSNEDRSIEVNLLQPKNMLGIFFNFIIFVLLNFIETRLPHEKNISSVSIPVKSRLDKSTEVTADELIELSNKLVKFVIFSSVS